MRISGGIAKGRKVSVKKVFSQRDGHDELRPTSAKVREALFDILRSRINGSSFLDLYAGTGAVGIEALSRGAGRAVFVESDALRAKTINDMLNRLGFRERAEVIKADAKRFLAEEDMRRRKYDIIFVDPPYHTGELPEILKITGKADILEAAGVVIAEHFSKSMLPDIIDSLKAVKNYRYGDTTLTVYKKERA